MNRYRAIRYFLIFSLSMVIGVGFAAGKEKAKAPTETEKQLRSELDALKQKVQQLETIIQEFKKKDEHKSAESKTETSQPDTNVTPQQVQELDQQVRILQRQRELDLEEAKTKAATTPKVTADKKGFSIVSPNNDFQLRLRGYIQADSRFFIDDEMNLGDDTFTLRRVRPILEGTLWDYYNFRFMPDFGGGTSTIQDAYLDIQYRPEIQLQAGKFKPPVGLERLASGSNLLFVERGLPTALVPNRDVGVQVHGDFLDGRLSYAAGVFNGVADGGSGDANIGDGVDFAARLFTHPFLQSDENSLRGLGFGVAASYGDQEGTGALPSNRTEGQSKFFTYLTDAKANGEHTRISPQGYYYYGPFGLLGEYVISSQEIERAGTIEQLDNDAWQVQASYVLTGENASYKGVKPKKPLNFSTGDWGAFEAAVRYGELSADDDIFLLGYAKDAASARGVDEYVLGLNWYFNDNALFKINFAHTEFTKGSAGGDRDDENAILTRFQISF